MAAQGQTFDGLNSIPINISTSAQAKYFNASGSIDQFRTEAANMTFKTAGSQPTYSFTDTLGTTLNSTLQAGTLTLANKFTTNKGGNVITGASGDTLPGLTIEGSSFTSTVTPLKINNTSLLGPSVDINQVSGEFPTLSLTANGAGYFQYIIQRSLATNMPNNAIMQHIFGKDTSSNANAYYLRYQYSTNENFRNFSIQAHGAPTRSLEIRKSDIVGTDASTGSVIVNGGLATDTIRVGGNGITFYPSRLVSSGVTLKSSSSSSNYSLILPSNIGSASDYLQLSSASTGQLQWAPGTSGGSGSSYLATLQGLTTTFTVPSYTVYNTNSTLSGTDSVVVFGTLTYNLNTGIEYNPSGAANANYFRNTSGGTIYVDVTAYTKSPKDGNGNLRYLEIRKATSTSVAPASATQIAVNRNLGQTTTDQFVNVSGTVTLGANECFFITAVTTSSTAIANSNISVWASVLGGAGTQSITLNLSDSNTQAIFTTNGQQIGQHPSVNLGFATDPTGTGNQLVRATGPTISNLTTTGTTIGDIEKVNSLGLMKSTDPSIVTTIKCNSSTTSSFDFILPVNNGSAGQFLTSTGLIGALTWSNTCNSLSLNGFPGITTTIKATSTTTSYDFILPTSSGTAGQFLTSNGDGNALVWANTVSNQPLSITAIGSYIGTSTTQNNSVSQPSLMVNGTTPTSTSAAPLIVNNYNSLSQDTISIGAFAPQIPNFTNTTIRFGRSTSNSADLQYYYETSGSDYNYIGLKHYQQIPTMKIFKPNLTAPAVTIAGGLTSTKFTCSGNIETVNLSASGTVTATTSVSTARAIISSKNSTIGAENVILNTSSEYICDINGTCASITTQPILRVQNHQLDITTTDSTTIGAYSPNMPLNYSSYIRFGKNLVSARNHARLGYTYIGDGSNSNFASLGLYAENDSIKVYKVNTSSTGTSTGTLVVTGDIGCSNITTGTCTASTVSSTNISTTSISTTNLTVGGNNYTPTGGTQTDLTIWWAYYTSDPSSTNLQYPSIPGQGGGSSGNIQNQRYYWQQIGKSYTFSFNFYCTFDNTSLQMHMLFLRMNSHTPPTPACGSYTMNLTADTGTTESFASQVKFGLGTYIPAM